MMDDGLLGIIRVGGKSVRFFEPPTRPDFAWVALDDILKAAKLGRFLTDAPLRQAYFHDEATTASASGEAIVIVPHLVALGVAQAGDAQKRAAQSLEDAYWKANAEATKLMFIGMTDAERQKFIGGALVYNERLVLNRGEQKRPFAERLADWVRRFSVPRLFRRSPQF